MLAGALVMVCCMMKLCHKPMVCENAQLHENTRSHENARSRVASLLKTPQDVRQTYVMGILNITPDSFTGDGLLNQGERRTHADDQFKHILDYAEHQIADGAFMLDIGGESTRPGATPVSEDEEIARVVPVIHALRHTWPDLPLSIDTSKAAVAHMRLCTLVNDVSGLSHDPAMVEVIASTGAPLILMHNAAGEVAVNSRLGGRSASSSMPRGDMATGMPILVRDALVRAVDAACARGIDRSNIIVDPGIGFVAAVESA
jgi:dihydropteroate synthase